MEIKTKTKKVIDSFDWDSFVQKVYGKPYCFQQQNGCQSRGNFHLTVPDFDSHELYAKESIPEIINAREMGVRFSSWLERDINKKVLDASGTIDFTRMWWERNFYPDIQAVANDLYEKGLLEAGEYVIDIDW